MKPTRAIKVLLALKGMTVQDLADKTGVKYPAMSARLRQEGMTVKTLAQMCKACGYKVVVVEEDVSVGVEVE